MSIKFIKIFIITFLACILALEVFWVLCASSLLNSATNYKIFQAVVEKKIGCKLYSQNLKIKTYPDFSIHISADKIELNCEKSIPFYASNVDVNFNIFTLFTNRICVKSVNADELRLEILKDKDKNVLFGRYLVTQDISFDKTFCLVENLKFSNSQFVFKDVEYNKIYLANLKTTEINYKKNRRLYLKTDAKLFVNNVLKTTVFSDFDINLKKKLPVADKENIFKVSNFDIADYKSYFVEKNASKLVDVSGNIDFLITGTKDNCFRLNSKLSDFRFLANNKLDSLIAPNEIMIGGVLGLDGDHLNIKQSTIRSNDFDISVDGVIKKYLFANRQTDLNINFSDSSINAMYWLLPSIPNDEFEIVQKLKQYGFWGVINGSVLMKGDLKSPELYGDIVASDVYIVKNNPLVPHSVVNAKFEKDRVVIDTRIFVGKGEYVNVQGLSELKLYPKGEFSIVSSPNVDLSMASYMLIPIHKIVGFDLGPVPYMEIKGSGNINLKTNGTIFEGNAYGQFNFKDVNAKLEGLNLELQNADGSLEFLGRDLRFKTSNAYIDKYKLAIDANANLDGNIDLNVSSKSINIANLFNILSTSQILESKREIIEPISLVAGSTSMAVKIKGVVKDYGDVLRHNNLDIQGKLNLKDCRAISKFSPIEIEKLNGVVDFNDVNWTVDLKGQLANALIYIKGNSIKLGTNLNISAQNVKISEFIKKFNLKNVPDINSYLSFNAVYKSTERIIRPEKINAKIELKKINSSDKTNYATGTLYLKDGNLSTQNLKANIQNSDINIQGKVLNIFSPKYSMQGKLNIDGFDLSELNKIKTLYILPENLANILNTYENYSGFADVDLVCNNNYINGQVNLDKIKFNHTYFKTPVLVDTGKIIIKGSRIYLDSVIAQIDNNPMFVNLSVWDLDKTAKLDGYFTSKINEDFVNKYVNSKLTYPIKTKGDITLTVDISGDLNNLKLTSKLKLAKNSDIYYMGANLGNEDEVREINANFDVLQNNTYLVKHFDFVRFIKSQDGREYPLSVLVGRGILNMSAKKLYVNKFDIETLNKANAKLFNLIFKKSAIKNGLFECKLHIKGNLQNPQIRGFLDFENVEIPLYETFIKNASVKFKADDVTLKTNGIALGSDYTLNAVVKNNFDLPIVFNELELVSEKLNLDSLVDNITQIPAPNSSLKLIDRPVNNAKSQVDIGNIRIKNGRLISKETVVKDLIAYNFNSEFAYSDDLVLKLPKVEFDITTGKILGNASYDFVTEKIKMNLNALNVDSNKIASSLFGFKDQLFGSANGNLSIVTKGNSQDERLKNMTGFAYFEVADGKMPKLGSVEYLLRAGNFIKSGITGLTINNIIDILSPVKTGEFDTIKGSLDLKNGVVRNVEVYSKSNNLNLFINGEFDIIQQYANMRVYGRLKQKETNFLGKVGNVSFNSLISQIPGMKLNGSEKEGLMKELNKIPGVETDDNKYKNFTVKIDGDINTDKYVKNFRWID